MWGFSFKVTSAYTACNRTAAGTSGSKSQRERFHVVNRDYTPNNSQYTLFKEKHLQTGLDAKDQHVIPLIAVRTSENSQTLVELDSSRLHTLLVSRVDVNITNNTAILF